MDREQYIEVLSKTVKTAKESNEDYPIHIGLECIEDILQLLKEQKEIVRCKDCKNGGIDQSGIKGVWCPAHAEWHDNNWFCADGKHKEDQ